MTDHNAIDLGHVVLRRTAGDLEVEVFGRNISFAPVSFSPQEWAGLRERTSAVTNLVPFTMLLTTLLDEGKVTPDELMGLAAGFRGTVHFRPSDRDTHAVARSAVATLLGLET